MAIILPENVQFVIDTLKSAGFEAYIVGGCVRDCLLGLTPCDFDICTSAKPDDIIKLFQNTVKTGIKHGTVTVIIDKTQTEVTTFRTDGKYNDCRHPEKVVFVSDLKTDLSRRDFTVNAMCYSPESGLIDYFGGINDLNAKTLRAVGNADKRFKEDALRILRLFRFCCTLGFTAENNTLNTALKNAQLLKNVSAERIREELLRAACGDNITGILPLLETGALATLDANSQISKIPLLPSNIKLKFFAFLKLSGNNLLQTLDFLKCSNVFKDYCLKLESAICLKTDTRTDVKKLLRLLENNIFDLLDYKTSILNEDISDARNTAKDIIAKHEPYKISQLAVNGCDIANKGYHGEQIGFVLENILQKVTEHPSLNTKEKILSLI